MRYYIIIVTRYVHAQASSSPKSRRGLTPLASLAAGATLPKKYAIIVGGVLYRQLDKMGVSGYIWYIWLSGVGV